VYGKPRPIAHPGSALLRPGLLGPLGTLQAGVLGKQKVTLSKYGDKQQLLLVPVRHPPVVVMPRECCLTCYIERR